MSTDEEWRAKCQNLKRKIILVEESNQLSSVAISRAKMAVNRLRLEYSILLERLEKKAILSESESEESDLEITEGKKILKRKKPSVPQPRDPDMPKRPINPYLV
jgi:non-histone protein 10